MKASRQLPAALIVLFQFLTPCLAQEPPSRTPGINLNSGILSYDNACIIFADLIKGASGFNGFRKVAPKPGYRPDGWPTRVDASTGSTTMIVGLNAYLPKGEYTLRADGKGKIAFQGGFNGQTWCVVEFNGDGLPRVVKRPVAGIPWGNQVTMDFLESDPEDPIRNLSFVLPGHVGKTFYDGFLNDLKPFSTLRIMDWQVTNGSSQVNWSDRITRGYSYRLRRRVEEEVACELANTLYRDLWICIPALSSDDYVRNLAMLIDRNLAPYLRVYVEFSNEVWNSSMPQYKQLQNLRAKDTNRLAGDWEWIAHRDGRLVNLFKANLSADRECIRVLARQAAYPATLTIALKQYKADGYQFDALSCAGYFVSKTNLDTATTLYKTNPAAAVTAVIDGMYGSIPQIVAQVAWYQSMADANGVPLVLYEAGQHLVNSKSGASTPLLMAVNRDPRMGLAYTDFINALPESVGGVCWYNDTGTNSMWGCWGLKEQTGQSLATAHKYRAVIAKSSLVQIPPPPAAHSNAYMQGLGTFGYDNYGQGSSGVVSPAQLGVEGFGGRDY